MRPSLPASGVASGLPPLESNQRARPMISDHFLNETLNPFFR
jgi:hypothetical protein